ncbi:uncharacterized protein LOC106643932 [Copidosoma floridanum]|uniref:uncharacterized protein LOC106643932 n=1 Tax=Copidosoma floridanum TaxID=29053 RepID=UPI0006C9A457|nr:uncharacterized protein LOC106643932 [Copidosoma floridanum]
MTILLNNLILKMWGKTLLLHLLCSSLVLSFANGQIDVILEGLGYLYDAYEFISEKTKIIEIKPSSEERHYMTIENTLRDLSLKLDGLVSDIPEVTDIVHRLGEVRRKFKFIDRRYNDYLKHKHNRSLYDPTTVIDFYKKMTKEMPEELFNIYDNVISLNQHSLASLMEKYIEKLDPYCQRSKSRQRYFYDFFASVVSYELKCIFAIDYAYELKHEHEKNVKSKQEMIDWKSDAENVVRSTIMDAKMVLARADRDMWRCDPAKPVENETFVELKLFQRILYRGWDFFESVQEYLDESRCPKPTKGQGARPIFREPDYPLIYPTRQRHCDNVVDCKELPYNEPITACILKDTKQRRRYSSVNETYKHEHPSFIQEFKNLFKSNNYCHSNSTENVFKSYYDDVGGLKIERHKSCDCICDEQEDSDRYISLEPAISDTHKNFVVTGVKFVLEKHTLYVQIQQGKLLPNGYIDEKTVGWKDIEYVSEDTVPLPADEARVKYRQPSYGKNVAFEFEGKKVFKLDWYDRRGLYLDDIEFTSTEVVTGVRFDVEQSENGTFNVKLDVQANLFDHGSGLISEGRSIWWSEYLMEPKRTHLALGEYDKPTSLDNAMNVPDGVSNQYTEFTPSAYSSKDAGQTTLPLIDIQPVVSSPPVPLSGISLDVKRTGLSGGYLMLKTETFNELAYFKTRVLEKEDANK